MGNSTRERETPFGPWHTPACHTPQPLVLLALWKSQRGLGPCPSALSNCPNWPSAAWAPPTLGLHPQGRPPTTTLPPLELATACGARSSSASGSKDHRSSSNRGSLRGRGKAWPKLMQRPNLLCFVVAVPTLQAEQRVLSVPQADEPGHY